MGKDTLWLFATLTVLFATRPIYGKVAGAEHFTLDTKGGQEFTGLGTDPSLIRKDFDTSPLREVALKSTEISQNASYQEIPELINGTSSLARIAYGKSVPKGVMPFAVFLEIEAADGVYNCGGTLIGKETVLTAAHCFFDEFGYLAAYSAVAVVGERVIKRSNKLYEVTDVVKPSGFNPAFSYELFGDIAIIKLGSRPNKKAMKLGSKKTSVPKWYITAGWGLTEDNRRASEVLQYAAVPSLSIRQVQTWTQNIGAYYSMEVDHIAAGLGSDRADSCQGDSGGPLFKPGKQYSNSESSTDVLMGVVSYGLSSRCGLKNRNVGFYTSVPYWRSWILSQMKKRGWK